MRLLPPILPCSILAAAVLAGCSVWPSSLPASQSYPSETPIASRPPATVIAPPTATSSSSPSTVDFILEDLPIQITLPMPYEPVRSREENRRGSWITYTFPPYERTHPALQEIQFFTEDSIRDFTKDCEGPCFHGDYPTLERYVSQAHWFESMSGSTYGEPITLGGLTYLVTNRSDPNCDCLFREYTTFIEGIKIDIWVRIDDVTQVAQSDAIVKAIRFGQLGPIATPTP